MQCAAQTGVKTRFRSVIITLNPRQLDMAVLANPAYNGAEK